MKTTLNTFLYIAVLSFMISAKAYGFSGAKYPSVTSSEASFGCESGRCLAQAPKSNILNFCEEMKARAAWASDMECTNVAIFDDGNDRELVKDLRKKKNLTTEEKAILEAANKVGAFGFCGGKGGNAFLIRHNGRDAIVVAAHIMLDKKSGRLKCSEGDFAGFYMPNANHYDSKNPKANKSFVFKKVGIEFPPVNWNELKRGGFSHEEDFAIFYLDEKISQDKMLDGTQRGYLKYSNDEPTDGNLYMLGVAKDIGGSVEMVYQSQCDGYVKYGRLFHGCDTLERSSGSLIGTLEGGEIKFRGLHVVGTEDTALSHEDKKDEDLVNIGTLSEYVKRAPITTSSASFKLSN